MDGGSGGTCGGLGCGELGLLRGDLVEDLLLIKLRENLAFVDRCVDVGVKRGDDARGLGFDLDFGNGLDLASGDDGAGDVAGLRRTELGGVKRRGCAEFVERKGSASDKQAEHSGQGDPKLLAGFGAGGQRGLRAGKWLRRLIRGEVEIGSVG